MWLSCIILGASAQWQKRVLFYSHLVCAVLKCVLNAQIHIIYSKCVGSSVCFALNNIYSGRERCHIHKAYIKCFQPARVARPKFLDIFVDTWFFALPRSTHLFAVLVKPVHYICSNQMWTLNRIIQVYTRK